MAASPAYATPLEAAAASIGLLAASALLVWLLYARADYVLPIRAHMTFFQHAREFVARLRRVLFLFAFWTTTFLVLRFEVVPWRGIRFPAPVFDVFDNAAAHLYRIIVRDQVPEGVGVLVDAPTEAVAAQLQLSLLLAILLAMPALLFEIWAFFGPGLHPKEQAVLARSLPVALVLFLAGAAFAYAYIIPLMLETLYKFAQPLGATSFIEASSLIATVTTFCTLFGLAFQLPLVLVVLVRLGAVRPQVYLQKWRHVTLGIFIVAAVVTDPTIVSQLLVAGVLLALYWGGVGASFLLAPARADSRASSRTA